MKNSYVAIIFIVACLFFFIGIASAEELKLSPGSVGPDFKMAGMKILFFISVVAFMALLINRNKNRFLNVGATNSKIEVIEERVLQGATKVSLLSISNKQFLLTTTNTGGIAVFPLGNDENAIPVNTVESEPKRDLINV